MSHHASSCSIPSLGRVLLLEPPVVRAAVTILVIALAFGPVKSACHVSCRALPSCLRVVSSHRVCAPVGSVMSRHVLESCPCVMPRVVSSCGALGSWGTCLGWACLYTATLKQLSQELGASFPRANLAAGHIVPTSACLR